MNPFPLDVCTLLVKYLWFDLYAVGLHRSAKKEDMAKHRIQTAEQLLKLCDQLSKEVQCVTIK